MLGKTLATQKYCLDDITILTITVNSVTSGPVCNMGVVSTKQKSESVHFEPDSNLSNVVIKELFIKSYPNGLALKKKLAACSNGLQLEIKSSGGGTVMRFDTAMYERFRKCVQTYYEKLNRNQKDISIQTETSVDKTGAVIGYNMKVFSEGRKQYTVNLYHTTNTVQINGRKELEFVNQVLPAIKQNLGSTKELESLNNSLCDVLAKLKEAKNDSNTEVKICRKCNRNCRSKAVMCFGKEHWVHYSCERLAEQEIRMIEDTDHFLYRCKSCTANEESSVDVLAQNHATDLEQRCVLFGESLNHVNSMENMIADDSWLTIQDSDAVAQPEDKVTTQMDCNPVSIVSCAKPLCAKSFMDNGTQVDIASKAESLRPTKTIQDAQAKALDGHLVDLVTTMDSYTIKIDQVLDNQKNFNQKATDNEELHRRCTDITDQYTTNIKDINRHFKCLMDKMEDFAVQQEARHQCILQHMKHPIDKEPTCTLQFKPETNSCMANDHTEGSQGDQITTKVRLLTLEAQSEALQKTVAQQQILIEALLQKMDKQGSQTSIHQNKGNGSYAEVAAVIPKSGPKKIDCEIPLSTSLPVQDKILWFNGKLDPLSNLHEERIRVFDRWYDSAEQAYQHKKAEYHNLAEEKRRIWQSTSSRDAMNEGQSIKTTLEWKADKEKFMHEILRAKFQHSAKYRDALLQSGQRPLAEQTRHPFWGGISGHNRLGLLHMKVRDAATNGDISLANTKPGNETSIRIGQPNQNMEARVNLRVATKDKDLYQVYDNNITARQQVPAGMVKNSIGGSRGGSRDSDRNTSVMPNKPQTQRRTVAIIGDSNTRGLNPAWMSKRYDFRKYEAMTTSEAVHIASGMETPDIALLHVGTNDIGHQPPTK